MISSAISKAFSQATRLWFSTVKKPKMELTIRTPYNTIVKDFDGFSRVIAKTNDGVLVVQNKSPPALYILPPGPLRIRLTRDVKDVSGDFMHTGGWAIVHPDNTCEVNLMDIADRKSIKAEDIDRVDIKDADTVAGKYASKNRRLTSKTFTKKVSM